MTDSDAFLTAIKAAPDDDLPRLVYADWLDENGGPDRAAFIRLSTPAAMKAPATREQLRDLLRRPGFLAGLYPGIAAGVAAGSAGWPEPKVLRIGAGGAAVRVGVYVRWTARARKLTRVETDLVFRGGFLVSAKVRTWRHAERVYPLLVADDPVVAELDVSYPPPGLVLLRRDWFTPAGRPTVEWDPVPGVVGGGAAPLGPCYGWMLHDPTGENRAAADIWGRLAILPLQLQAGPVKMAPERPEEWDEAGIGPEAGLFACRAALRRAVCDHFRNPPCSCDVAPSSLTVELLVPPAEPGCHAGEEREDARGRRWRWDGAQWLDAGPVRVRRTGVSLPDGEVGYRRVYDEAAGAWVDGEEVRLVEPEGPGGFDLGDAAERVHREGQCEECGGAGHVTRSEGVTEVCVACDGSGVRPGFAAEEDWV